MNDEEAFSAVAGVGNADGRCKTARDREQRELRRRGDHELRSHDEERGHQERFGSKDAPPRGVPSTVSTPHVDAPFCGEERFDPLDFLARVLMQAPEPRLHLVRYYGAYSSVARGRASREELSLQGGEESPAPSSAERRRLRRSWARMIAKIYEVDPLLCECGAQMKVIAFITEHAVIRKILRHVRHRGAQKGRGPPFASAAV